MNGVANKLLLLTLIAQQHIVTGSSIDNPCFTLIARMDKRPPCLVTTESGEMAVEIYETDHSISSSVRVSVRVNSELIRY